MFNNILKAFKKNNNKVVENQPITIETKSEESEKVNIEVSEPVTPIEEPIPEIKEETEKPALKAIEKITQYKNYYQEEFQACKRLDEVLDAYIRLTYYEDCLDELRLKYVSMYLFSSEISKDKMSVEDIKDMVANKIDANHKAEPQKQNVQNNQLEDNKEPIPQSKLSMDFNRLKQIYSHVFSGKRSIEDIIQAYVSNTDGNDLFDELRLRYLSMHLFNSNITNEKWSSTQLKLSIGKLVNPAIVEELVSNENLVNDKLYLEVKDSVEKYLNMKGTVGSNIDADEILLNVIAQFGDYTIEQDFFVCVLFKALEDMNVSIPVGQNDFKNYLEERLLHIRVIKYWESEMEKLLGSEVFFFGRHLRIQCVESHYLISNLKQGPLDVSAIQLDTKYEDKPYSININGTSFVAGERIKNDILKYFEKINQGILTEVNKNVTVIKEQLTKIPTELTTMIENYLDMLSSNLFLDRDNYIAFEQLISYNNYYTRQFVDSSSDDRDRIINKLKEDTGLFNSINTIVDNDFKRFVKVAGKYLDIPEGYHSSIVWTLIKKTTPEHFSELWIKEYGVHLNEEESQDLDQSVDSYCRCGDIPTKNIGAVGLFTYHLMNKEIFPEEINTNFIKCNILLIDKIFEKVEELELEMFEKKLTKKPTQSNNSYSINDVDLMDGHEFERFISLLFTKMGYQTEVTRGSGDQGLDVLAEKNGIKIGIQAKCYTNKVTNKAVQEISAALSHYNCSKGMVITNNYFTDSAVELAESNNIILWDRDLLKKKIEETFMEG